MVILNKAVHDTDSAIALEMESLEEKSTLILEASGLDQQEAREGPVSSTRIDYSQPDVK